MTVTHQPGTFEHILAQLADDTNDEFGAQFEDLADWALWHSNDWGPKIAALQPWSDWARQQNAALGRAAYLLKDTGIDRVLTTVDGQVWAVQHKGHHDAARRIPMERANNTITLAQSMRADGVLFVTSGAGVTDNVRHGAARLPIPYITLDRAWMRRIQPYPTSHAEVLEQNLAFAGGGRRYPRKLTLRHHQIDAVEAVSRSLRHHREVQLIAACGFGKTVTSHEIGTRQGARTMIVCVSTLSLMRQVIVQYQDQAAEHGLNAVSVCSDDSVGRTPIFDRRLGNLTVPNIDQPDQLADWLAAHPGTRERPTVVFATYQSIQVVVDAQHRYGAAEFDFCWADEAHNLVPAGTEGGKFGELVKRRLGRRKELLARRRVYATATPRVHTEYSHAEAAKRGVTLDSLGPDSDAFGPIAYSMGFGQAIDAGILVPYDLNFIAINVDDGLVEAINTRQYVEDEEGISNAQMYAAVEALAQMYERGARTFLVYFNNLRSARTFSRLVRADPRLPGSAAVEGTQRAAVREDILSRLDPKQNPDGYVVCNVATLGEGIDVPHLEVVMFADPKKSETDILQAVGRAMRRSPGKTHASIVIPIALRRDEEFDVAMTVEQIEADDAASPYRTCFEVLRVMASDDDYLVQWMAEPKFGEGPRPAQKGRNTDRPAEPDDQPDRAPADGPDVDDADEFPREERILPPGERHHYDRPERRVNLVAAGFSADIRGRLTEHLRLSTIRVHRGPRGTDEQQAVEMFIGRYGLSRIDAEDLAYEVFQASAEGATAEQVKAIIRTYGAKL